jgi:hypothetical protein
MRLLPAIVLLALASCKGPDGAVYSPLVSRASLETESGSALMDVRFDGDSFVGFGSGYGSAEIFGKFTGLPIWGPQGFETGGVYVASRSRKFSARIEHGAPLPAWCADLFRAGEAESLGYTFGQ